MIWPRGFVAAAAFWNYDNATDSSSPEFVAGINKLNGQLLAQKLSTCPTNCSCDQVSACGKNYLPPPPPPPPPSPGAKIVMKDCATASSWKVMAEAGASFKIATAGASPLCWSFSSDPEGSTHCTGCLLLGDCAAAPAFNHTASGELVSMKTR